MSETKFNKAVEIIQNLPKDGPVKPSQEDQLYFYKYFKQATIGDVNTTRPGMLDFVGKTKWDSWSSVKGTDKVTCWKHYVEHLEQMLKKSDAAEAKASLAQLEAA